MRLIEKHSITGWEIVWECKVDGLHFLTSSIKDCELPKFISWDELINNLAKNKEDNSWDRKLI